MGKKLVRSKTFWTNVIFVVIAVIAYFSNESITEAEIVTYSGMILPFINIILRLITKEEIVW
jgi:hypothetical protein